MGRYASQTAVSVEKTRGEIERTLSRYGATAFAYAWDGPRALISFKAHSRLLRFILPLPDKAGFRYPPKQMRHRTAAQVESHWEQACRQRWRALALAIKAKLEAVEAGISQFEDEFLANIVLPNGQTMGDHSRPLIEKAYESGTMPLLLPGPGVE